MIEESSNSHHALGMRSSTVHTLLTLIFGIYYIKCDHHFIGEY